MSWFLLAWLYTTILSFTLPMALFVTIYLGALGWGIIARYATHGTPYEGEADEFLFFLARKRFYISIFFAILFLAAIPGKNDLKFIVGAGVVANGVEWAATNEEAKKLPESIMKSVNHFLSQVNQEKAQ